MNIIRLFGVTAAILIGVLSGGISEAIATTITIQNNDGVNEGFNDPTVVTPVAGNPGTTLGQQRLNVFQAAADYWETKLDSNVDIIVTAQMDPLFCSANSAALGSAGPLNAFINFPEAPVNDTIYPSALANSLAGFDVDLGVNDINATFNSDLDDPGCLGSIVWSHVIGEPAPPFSVDLFSTVLHEIGHGLGFLSFVNSAGQRLGSTLGVPNSGFNDTYMQFLRDQETGIDWGATDTTDAQRAASSVNGPDLVWIGPKATEESTFLTAGLTSGQPQMYAPSPYQQGSSVSHWNTTLTPNELMEPSATTINEDWLSIKALYDMGWQGNPCLKTTLPNNQWTMIALECVPPGTENTIADLFGDDITGVYGNDWVIFSYDASTNSYTSPAIGDALQVGAGYWIIQVSVPGADVILDIPRDSHRTPVVNSTACTSSKGCLEYALVTESGVIDWNMVGNPFLNAVDFDALRIVTDSGTCASGCTPNAALAANIANNEVFTFNGSSPAYIVIDSGDTIPARAGVWMATLGGANGLNPRLLIPFE